MRGSLGAAVSPQPGPADDQRARSAAGTSRSRRAADTPHRPESPDRPALDDPGLPRLRRRRPLRRGAVRRAGWVAPARAAGRVELRRGAPAGVVPGRGAASPEAVPVLREYYAVDSSRARSSESGWTRPERGLVCRGLTTPGVQAPRGFGFVGSLPPPGALPSAGATPRARRGARSRRTRDERASRGKGEAEPAARRQYYAAQPCERRCVSGRGRPPPAHLAAQHGDGVRRPGPPLGALPASALEGAAGRSGRAVREAADEAAAKPASTAASLPM